MRHWVKKGASGCGWTSPTLPMPFARCAGRLRMYPRRGGARRGLGTRATGRLWTNASYVLGDTLDSVMNYPLRDALIAFLTHKGRAAVPRAFFAGAELSQAVPLALMNLMGSHDGPRILRRVGRKRRQRHSPRSARAPSHFS
ncbi:MAG: hypothetical protein ACLS7Z_09160 [Christensenellales bacterium]